jgi:hypothetical protein
VPFVQSLLHVTGWRHGGTGKAVSYKVVVYGL